MRRKSCVFLARLRRPAILAIAIVLLAPAAAALDADRGDRALRDLRATIADVRSTPDADGTIWLDLVLRPEGGEQITVRVAPTLTLTEAGFRVSPGDVVRVRFFTEPEPYPVQKIRNETTRGQIRLRCLHGEPLWNPTDPSKGLSPGGGRRGDPGGPRHRGGR